MSKPDPFNIPAECKDCDSTFLRCAGQLDCPACGSLNTEDIRLTVGAKRPTPRRSDKRLRGPNRAKPTRI